MSGEIPLALNTKNSGEPKISRPWKEKAVLLGLEESDAELLEKIVRQIKANKRGITIPHFPRIQHAAEATTALMTGELYTQKGEQILKNTNTFLKGKRQ